MGIEIVRRNALKALLPPANVPLADWIESSVYIPASASALPGRMQLWPFQRGWCEAIEDPEIERITILKGARIGYTQWLSTTIAHFVANAPAPIIALQPTAYSLQPMTPEISALNWKASLKPHLICADSCRMMQTIPDAPLCLRGAFRAEV